MPLVDTVLADAVLADTVLEVTDAGVSLSGRPIVRDLNLAVTAGEVVALLGANGSGKSTLVKAVVGLHPLSRGEVRLFGSPLSSFTQWPRLGYVPQRSTIAQGVPSSVWEVVASGRVSRRRPFRPLSSADRRAVQGALETVGLSDRSHSPIATLSGGQQQRVLMARTLAGEPELLLLDEPNAGVDQASQQDIADAIGALSTTGATVLIVLHELGPFAPLIDRMLLLSEGRLVYDGPPTAAAAGDHGHHHLPPAEPGTGPGVQAPLEGDGR